MTIGKTFEELVDIVKKLRDPVSGCPWDCEQTPDTLKPFVIEEAYEVVDAITNAREKLCDELGDLLLQVVLLSQIQSEANDFNITDVIKIVSDKMILRHPHVFGDEKVDSVDDVLKNWFKIKDTTQKDKRLTKGLPALLKLKKIVLKYKTQLKDLPRKTNDKMDLLLNECLDLELNGADVESELNEKVELLYQELNSKLSE